MCYKFNWSGFVFYWFVAIGWVCMVSAIPLAIDGDKTMFFICLGMGLVLSLIFCFAFFLTGTFHRLVEHPNVKSSDTKVR